MTYEKLCEKFNFEMPEYAAYYYDFAFFKHYKLFCKFVYLAVLQRLVL